MTIRVYLLTAIFFYAELGMSLSLCCRRPPSEASKHQATMQLAIKGDKEAQLDLAYNYQHGIYVKQNYIHAAKWYERASNQGVALAKNNLATLHLHGQGVSLSKSDAMRLFREAAEQGLVIAQKNLATIYVKDKDYKRATSWLLRAAARNDAVSENALGSIYKMEKDDKSAFYWWKRSAKHGFAIAQVNVGLMYELGQGVEPSDIAAVKYYELAAEQNDARGQCYLAEMYEQGRGGLLVNVEKASRLYQLSADQKYDRAQTKLTALKKEHFYLRLNKAP